MCILNNSRLRPLRKRLTKRQRYLRDVKYHVRVWQKYLVAWESYEQFGEDFDDD
jgi:hypothetical protein